jgi:hypothetical protein
MSYETVTMGARDGEFLLSEANGERSREQVTLAITAVALPAGQLLGVVGGNYVPYDPVGVDGSETVAAILYASKPVSAATQPAAVVVRDAEVTGSLVVGLDAGATTELAALGIVVR